MPMPMRGNRRNDDQTNKDMAGVQTSTSKVSESLSGPVLAGDQSSTGTLANQGRDEDSNTETGCLPPDTPLPGSNQDRRDDKITDKEESYEQDPLKNINRSMQKSVMESWGAPFGEYKAVYRYNHKTGGWNRVR